MTDIDVSDSPESHEHAPRLTRSVRARRHLLVLAYYFPPLGLSGVQRVSKLVKYLPLHDWDVTVLTVGEVGYFAHDYSLLEEVLASGARIERTRSLDPLRLLRRRGTIRMPSDGKRRFLSAITHTVLQPDNKIGWKRYALRRARELARDEHFDAIFATAPPFTDLLIGHQLRSELGIPLIVDYRDPWVDNRNYFYATPLHKAYAVRLEKRVLRNSDGVIVVNRRIKEQLIARYPFLSHTSVEIIANGYDPADIESALSNPSERSPRLVLTHSGHFDARRTPRFVFDALLRIVERNPALRQEIELRFVGNVHESFLKTATKLGLGDVVTTTGYLEHGEAVRQLVASDALWLTVYDPTITPGKVFEYMGTRRPILALSPEGAVRQVLRGYGAEMCVEPEDVDGIATAIVKLHGDWKRGTLPIGDPAKAAEFDQRRLAGTLARVLAYSLRI